MEPQDVATSLPEFPQLDATKINPGDAVNAVEADGGHKHGAGAVGALAKVASEGGMASATLVKVAQPPLAPVLTIPRLRETMEATRALTMRRLTRRRGRLWGGHRQLRLCRGGQLAR
jgi:hypothetical protein